MNEKEFTPQEMYQYIKDRHKCWCFIQPSKGRFYTFSRKSKLFGLITKEEVKHSNWLFRDEVVSDKEVVKKALINFADTPGKDIEVPFYVDKDGEFYLDVYLLWRRRYNLRYNSYPNYYKYVFRIINVFREIAEEFKLKLPPCIMDGEEMRVFNKYRSALFRRARLRIIYGDKTGNTLVVLDEA